MNVLNRSWSQVTLPFSLLVCAACLAGCDGEPRGGPRVPTFPITGVVHVDGKPAAMVKVECHRDTPDPKSPMMPAAMTSEDGAFEIGTYESGDGAPAGSYHLTFVWGEYNLMNGQYAGDRLKKRYADPAKSEITARVADEPVDLGVIELSTK